MDPKTLIDILIDSLVFLLHSHVPARYAQSTLVKAVLTTCSNPPEQNILMTLYSLTRETCGSHVCWSTPWSTQRERERERDAIAYNDSKA